MDDHIVYLLYNEYRKARLRMYGALQELDEAQAKVDALRERIRCDEKASLAIAAHGAEYGFDVVARYEHDYPSVNQRLEVGVPVQRSDDTVRQFNTT